MDVACFRDFIEEVQFVLKEALDRRAEVRFRNFEFL